MSVLDIRPTREYWNMKKRMKTSKQKNYIALLTIPEMPRTKEDEERLIKWLRSVASEIKKEDPDIFATPCRFRLMKSGLDY